MKSGKQKELVLGDAGAQRDPKTFSTGRTASSGEQRRKARRRLNGQPEITFEQIITPMMEAELAALRATG